MEKYLFNQKLLKEKYNMEIDLDLYDYKQRRLILEKWRDIIDNKSIDKLNEIQLKEIFVSDILNKVLRYKSLTDNIMDYNIKPEEKTKIDGTRADIVLGYFSNEESDYRVAIELKKPTTNLDAKQLRKNNHNTPVEQGFSYLPKYGRNCTWLIVSNFKEIRLYNANDATEYEFFSIKDIYEKDDVFKKFLYLLSSKSLMTKHGKSRVEVLWEENIKQEEAIEKGFYDLYKNTRLNLFNDILLNNKDILDVKTCLTKTQKILDRVIFVCFAEHKGLIPENIFETCIQVGKKSVSRFGVWEQVKGLFESIDLGNQEKGINQFNGGLFAEDYILNNLKIPNKCFENLYKLSLYDFNSDLNENILGHIFEKSISDLEELKLEINQVNIKKKDSKRNKDGIFYTPKYITKHIVNNTIRRYLDEKKKELGEDKLPELKEEDYETVVVGRNIQHKRVQVVEYKTDKIQKYINFWKNYRDVVKNIKILDPACGSGAFLNEAFSMLKKEAESVNEILRDLTDGEISFFDLDANILKNNLYGVDLNEESVEITKLSLWLKTANKYSLLTSLDNNIKCGNSIIDNKEVDCAKAFDWNVEFEDVMMSGGFDIIIGNPPYVSTKMIPEKHREYYWKKYKDLLISEMDLYELFLYEFCENKLKQDGFLGFITPNTYFTNKSFENLRKYLLKNVCVDTILDFPYRFFPFEDVNKETAIIIINKKLPNIKNNINLISINKENMKKIKIFNSNTYNSENKITIKSIINDLDNKIVIQSNPIILKMLKCKHKLGDYLNLHKGWMSVPNKTICDGIIYDKKILSSNDIKDNNQLNGILNKCLEGKDIHRYYIDKVDKFVNIENMDDKTMRWHKSPKIITQRIVGQNQNKIIATVDIEGTIIFPSGNIINLIKEDNLEDIYFYIGVINSSLINYFYNKFYGESNTNLTADAVKNIPIPNLKNVDKSIVINNSKILINKYGKLYLYTNKFLKNVFKILSIDNNPSNKLYNFYLLDFDEFYNELSKKKKLYFKNIDELEEYFNKYKDAINRIIYDINVCENTINTFVYDLYGITELESKSIEDICKTTKDTVVTSLAY
ncbi:restriction endonuclease subunit M [Clostridioides difficile]|uniref:Eco57I restriction-modification methylase domain-containing protein n=1 Tax=Clostridioides difficile TaxID=1496 RepID=UPI00038D24FE|nr:DNA methyltransferase [Clostridioides difficile]EQH27439.1 eco57I restriction-modification methylase family protein [Clostridioides difficile DA00212]MCJ0144720.1 Eco57I restriction-modification methylase domain-containing protein [Clostridioides difficile]MDB0503139.1 restriction endonuclease subunit M [Clostridioides difficile]MDB3405446.1 restriction endonuclease subunit M [Clostridioides difficile]MDB3513454.1 restriction endonuclease subunit M [Clostridioides difficile]